jgi:programmed cell death protein 5
MSDEDLDKIRKQRLEELQKQALAQNEQNQMMQKQQEAFEQQKNLLMRSILSSNARVRLENLRLAKKEFADAIEIQLIQLYQAGTLQRSLRLPLSDEEFKNILINAQKKRKDTKIRIL